MTLSEVLIMPACATCGFDTNEPLSIRYHAISAEYCCFECAITPLAPICQHCRCKVIGHGAYGPKGEIFCCHYCRDNFQETTTSTKVSTKENYMLCKEIMTKDPDCVVPATTVDQVAQLMASKDIGPVPIVDTLQNRKLLGIVTDRDLTLKVIAKGRDPKTTKVQEVMTEKLVFCGPSESIEEALKRMEKNNVRRILVAGPDNKLLGIITVSDIVSRMKDPGKTNELVSNLSCSH